MSKLVFIDAENTCIKIKKLPKNSPICIFLSLINNVKINNNKASIPSNSSLINGPIPMIVMNKILKPLLG